MQTPSPAPIQGSFCRPHLKRLLISCLTLCAALQGQAGRVEAADALPPALEALKRGKIARLESILGEYDLSHAGLIWAIDISADGRYAVTGSADRSAKLWNLRSRTEVRAFIGHDSDVTSVAFSPDASKLLTGSKDGTVRVWNVATGEQTAVLEGHDDWVLSVAFSPDALHAASGGRDKSVLLWDMRSAQPVARLEGHGGFVSSLAFSSDGGLLASASYDQSIRIWDVMQHALAKELRSNHGWLLSVCFANNGRSVLGASADNSIREWRVDTGLEDSSYIGHEGWVYSIMPVPGSGRFFTAGLDGTLRSWRYGERRPESVVADLDEPINSALRSADGAAFLLAVGNRIRIFDAASGKEQSVHRIGHHSAVRDLLTPPGKSELVTAGLDGQILVWDTKSPRIKRSLSRAGEGRAPQPYSALSYSRSGNILAAGTETGSQEFWDYDSGELKVELKNHDRAVTDLEYSPDGRYIVSGSADHSFVMLKVRDGLPTERRGSMLDYLGKAFFEAFGRHKGSVSSIDISPDSSRIISGSSDGALRLWDADREQWLQTYREHRSGVSAARFVGDKQHAISAAVSGKLRLIDLETGEKQLEFSGHRGAVVDLEVDEANRLFTASVDASVRIWDAVTGEELEKIDLRGVTDIPQALLIRGDRLYVGTLRGLVMEFTLRSAEKSGKKRR